MVYFGLQVFQPRLLYVLVGVLLLARFLARLPSLESRGRVRALMPFLVAAPVVAAGAISNSELLFLLLPGCVTVALAGVFIYSLFRPPSMIETFARMSMPDLAERDVRYCRRVTAVWSVFFLLNSLVIFGLSEAVQDHTPLLGLSPRFLWTLYAGIISYLLIGLLFAGEYLYRKWKFRRYGPSWPEPLLRRLMPPRGNVKDTFIPLHQLSVRGRSEDFPVSRSPDGTHSWSDFAGRVLALAGLLSETGADRWAVSCRDGFAFAVGLTAVWQAGKRAVLPPNRQPETLASIGETVGGFVTDAVLPVEAAATYHPLKHTGDSARPRLLDPSSPAAELFTSGSTGRHRSVPKTLAQLQNEVRTLEERWREPMGKSTVLATVSHQHIYGLLFKVLWPLSAGRTFDARSGLYPEEILDTARRLEHGVSLVSSPTHLDRLVQADDLEARADDIRIIFSSGGPLSEETASAVHERLGRYPLEVLGSTETGGVAWRTQDPEDHDGRWHPFEGVRVRESERGTLRVRSPLLGETDADGFEMGDRATVHDDGTFELRGRADREINLAGKRITLPDLEQKLNEHPFVAESAVCLREDPDGTRDLLGGVVVLTPRGSDWLEEHSRGALIDRLRDHVSGSFDPVAVPRFWAFPDRLPRDDQGKVTVPGLRRLLRRSPAPG